MPIVVEGTEVKRGDVLLYKQDGVKTLKQGTVLDVNDHIGAVKLQFAVNIKHNRLRSEWFAAASLRRTQPKES